MVLTRRSGPFPVPLVPEMDLPRTLDHGRTRTPASWHHRLAGGADGFHELDRGLMADRVMRPFTIIIAFERLTF